MPKSTAAPDFDDLLATISQSGGAPLKIDAVLAALPGDQRPKVEKALRDERISAARIAKALTKMGPDFSCGEGAVTTWRKRHGVG